MTENVPAHAVTEKKRMKYKAAYKAGLLSKVMEVGWGGLSAKENGCIGGIYAHMKMSSETGEQNVR